MNFHGGNIYDYNETKLLDYSSNINPFGVPDSFRSALIERMEEFTRYPDIQYRSLKRSIRQYLELGDAFEVIPGNGAVELIYKAISASGCKRVIGLNPSFSEYRRAAEGNGIEYVGVDAFTKNFEAIDVEVLCQNAAEGDLVVICNPNNPTGTAIDRQDTCRLAEALGKKKCKLLVDEAFIEFTPAYPLNSMVKEVQRFSNLTVVRAVTKFFGMPGIRLGYCLCGSKSTAERIKNSLEPWNINTAAVIAGCTVLHDVSYIHQSRLWLETELPYMYEGLNEIEGLKAYPSKANFHLVEITNKAMNAWALRDKMLKHNILIRTPDGFSGLSDYHFRLAVKDRASNDRILQEIGVRHRE